MKNEGYDKIRSKMFSYFLKDYFEQIHTGVQSKIWNRLRQPIIRETTSIRNSLEDSLKRKFF